VALRPGAHSLRRWNKEIEAACYESTTALRIVGRLNPCYGTPEKEQSEFLTSVRNAHPGQKAQTLWSVGESDGASCFSGSDVGSTREKCRVP
jgi:hypothetical protein